MQTTNMENSFKARERTGCVNSIEEQECFCLYPEMEYKKAEIVSKLDLSLLESSETKKKKKNKRQFRSNRIYGDRASALIISNSHYLKMTASQINGFLRKANFALKKRIWYSILIESEFQIEILKQRPIKDVVKVYPSWNMTLNHERYTYFSRHLGLRIVLPHEIELDDWTRIDEDIVLRRKEKYEMQMRCEDLNLPREYLENKCVDVANDYCHDDLLYLLKTIATNNYVLLPQYMADIEFKNIIGIVIDEDLCNQLLDYMWENYVFEDIHYDGIHSPIHILTRKLEEDILEESSKLKRTLENVKYEFQGNEFKFMGESITELMDFIDTVHENSCFEDVKDTLVTLAHCTDLEERLTDRHYWLLCVVIMHPSLKYKLLNGYKSSSLWTGMGQYLLLETIDTLMSKINVDYEMQMLKFDPFKKLSEVTQTGLQTGFSDLSEKAEKLVEHVKEMTTNVSNTVNSWEFNKVLEGMKGALEEAWSSMVGNLKDFFKDNGLSILEVIKTGVVVAINVYMFIVHPDVSVKSLITMNLLNMVPFSIVGIIQKYLENWQDKPQCGDIVIENEMQGAGDYLLHCSQEIKEILAPLLISTLTVFGRIKDFDILEVCKKLTILGNAIRALDTMTKVVPTFVEWFKNMCYKYWLGYDPILNSSQKLQSWAESSVRMLNYMYEEPNRVSNQICANHLIRRGMTLNNCISDKNVQQKNAVNTLLGLLRQQCPYNLSNLESMKKYRPAAYGVNFYGEPKTGKNVLAEVVGKQIIKMLFGITDAETEIYRRNAGSDFWDGYMNEFMVYYADFAQQADSVGKPNTEVLEIINSSNVTPFNLNMASLGEKGHVFFNSPFIMSASNCSPMNLHCPSIIKREALQRRFHLIFEVKERIDETHYRIRLAQSHDDNVTVNKIPDKILSINQIAAFIFQCFMHYYKRESELLERLLGDHVTFDLMEDITNIEIAQVKADKHELDEFIDAFRRKQLALKEKRDSILASIQAEPKDDFIPTSAWLLQHEVLKKRMSKFAEVVLVEDEARKEIERCSQIDDDSYSDVIIPETNHFLHDTDKHFPKKLEINIHELKMRLKYSYIIGNQTELCLVDNHHKDCKGKCLVNARMKLTSLWGDMMTVHDGSDLDGPVTRENSDYYQALAYIAATDSLCPFCIYKNIYPNVSLSAPLVADNFAACVNDFYGKALEKQLGSNKNRSTFKDMSMGALTTIVEAMSSNMKIIAAITGGISCIGLLFLGYKSFVAPKKEHIVESTDLVRRPHVKRTIKGAAERIRQIRTHQVQGGNNQSVKKIKLPANYDKALEAVDLEIQGVGVFPNKDPNFLDQLNKVIRNQISVYDVDTNKHIMFGVLLNDHTLLIPMHLIEFIQFVKKESEHKKADSLDDSDYDYRLTAFKDVNGMVHQFKLNECVVRSITDAEGEPVDAMLVRFPYRFPGYKDLLSLFVDEASLSSKLQPHAVLSTFNGGDTSTSVLMFSNTLRLLGSVTYGETDVEYVLPRHWKYTASTVKGSCGSVLLAYNNHWTKKIIGIHVAGALSTAEGISPVLTYESISAALAKFKGFELQGHVPELTVVVPDYIQEKVSNNILINDVLLEVEKPPAGLRIVGRSEKSSVQLDNDLGPTGLFNWSGRPITSAPALVKPTIIDGELVDPVRKALAKLTMGDVYIPQNEVDDAVASYKHMMVNCVNKDFSREVLSIEEGVFGVPDDPNIRPIALTTSAGIPLKYLARKKGKKDFIIVNDNGSYISPLLYDRVNKRLRDIKNYILECVLFEDCPKIETRPIDKVRAGKTRVFSTGPLEFNILVRMYFGNFISWFMQNRISNESAIGINPTSPEWTILAQHLLVNGNNFVAGDFSNYDGTQNIRLLWACLDVINWWYGPREEDNRIRTTLFQGLMSSVHLYGHMVYGCHHSNPSGNPLTSPLNTMYNCISMRLVWNRLSPEEYRGKFANYVRMIAYGDDNVLGIAAEVGDWFNQETISEVYETIGMVYTDENKKGISSFRKLDEIAFLKRGFRLVNGRYYAPLALDSLLEIPCWAKMSNGPKELKSSLESMGPEFVQYGRGFFKEWMDKLSFACLNTPGIEYPDFLSYDEYVRRCYCY